MIHIFFKKFKIEKGFSMVEVMVALVIITVGLLGISSLVIQNIQVESVNKNYVIAAMLAQEGLELTRNIRDKNWVTDYTEWYWYDNIYRNLTDIEYSIDYTYDIPDFTPLDITSEEARLYIKDGFYQHNLSSDPNARATPFYRIITSTLSDEINPDGNVDEGEHLDITCLVQWENRGKTYKYEAATQFYDWR